MDKEDFKISEFCYRYNISRSGFYREVNAKRLRIFKRGRSTLVARVDAEAWHEKLRKSSVPVDGQI